jgi:aryl-alcohol dehydrogenase-like predicted oxidoreductase
LSGKWKKGEPGTTRARTDDYGKGMYTRDSDYAIADRLTEVAKNLGLPNMQVALAWVLQKPGISAPIIGTSKPGHLEDALGALTIKLDANTIRKLEELYEPHPIVDHD